MLVTGDVKEGDFITTSTKLGRKKLENGYLLKKEMFGKVISCNSLEN